MVTQKNAGTLKVSAGMMLLRGMSVSYSCILCVAGIDHRNLVILDGVGIIPFVGVRHVVAFPSADGRTAAWKRPLYGVDGKERIAYIALHVLVRIGVAVLLAHVSVETSYLGGCTLGIEILILHGSRRR